MHHTALIVTVSTYSRHALGHWTHWLLIWLVLFFMAGIAQGQQPTHPLEPPDRSSPRATLKTFLDSADALSAFLAQEYLPSPSRAKFQRLMVLGETPVQCLDLSELPPAGRPKVGRVAAIALYETLSRLPLPVLEDIPDAEQMNRLTGVNANRWVIPHTEIALVRVLNGPRAGEFLFSPETVARANDHYEQVRLLAYTRPVPLENWYDILVNGGGWLIPNTWLQSSPAWLRTPLAGQAVWKWIALSLMLGVFLALLRWVYRLSQLGSDEHPFLQALAQSTLPAFLLIVMPIIAYLSLAQINLIGSVGSAVGLTTTAILFLAGAWIAWRIAPVIAEGIISSPKIPMESIDAHLIRISTRLLGIMGGATLLVIGADWLGMPVYGIIAGLGVGGLAVALAARPTLENLIGGLNLIADRPMRVGDVCKYGADEGTVEAIGIRSTRIRGKDRTLTTIPNGMLSRIPIVNITHRDRILIQSVIGVRYETRPEQLRYLLAKIREMLLGHPRIQPESARARLIGFGASSLDIEVFAYVLTRDWVEFLGIREDLLLRIMDIVEQCGTGFAFPSQTLYFARDGGLDAQRTESAEDQVRQWREEGKLPFPNFSPEHIQQMRGTVSYPPPGSPEASTTGSEPEIPRSPPLCRSPQPQ
ncbi:MAG: MscS family rane protein [Pseudomonadota bacterium]|nr:MscS family rane protein [Pseudomonadota bacterium]